MSKENSKDLLIFGGVVLGFVVLNKFTNLFGSNNTIDPNSLPKALETGNATDVNLPYYTFTLSDNDISGIATDLYNTIKNNYSGSDTNAVLGILKQCNTQGDVREVAVNFNSHYNENMLEFINSGGNAILPWNKPSADDIKTISNFINSLPL